MKERLCRAFCDALKIVDVPMGVAVSTAFRRSNGDVIGFYVSHPNEDGLYRIEDDGLTIPDLESSGFDLDNPHRRAELIAMLSEFGASFNEPGMTLEINGVSEADLPNGCIKMIQLLIRAEDLYMITKDRVANTFEQDATEAIARTIGAKAKVEVRSIVDKRLKDYVPDVVIRAAGRVPVAVYMTKSDQRFLEALLLQTLANYKDNIPLSVIALLEKPTSVSRNNWIKATNLLAAITVFSEGEGAAVDRIAREALGAGISLH